MLGDGDPMNDQSAHGSLAMALLAAGDRSNVAAAAVVTTMPYHEASFDPALSEILKAINFSMFCSLAMVQFNSYKETMAKELYFCKECLDVAFCEDCCPILKKWKRSDNMSSKWGRFQGSAEMTFSKAQSCSPKLAFKEPTEAKLMPSPHIAHPSSLQ